MVIVHTLGRAVIDAGTLRVTPASVRKFAVLLYLSAENGRTVSRCVLQELVFADQSESNARHSLRELAYQLRQAGVPIQSDRSGIAIATDAVRTDYAEIIAGRRLAAEHVEAAQGGFLPGYAPMHSEAFAEWLEGYRARISFHLSKALVREVMRAREYGDWLATERAARACLVLDPANEEGTLALAEVLAIGGSKVQALNLLDRYMDEVGERSRDVRLPAALLKKRIANLPESYSSQFTSPFVGRELEIAQLTQHLDHTQSDVCKCLILTGEPGIGKSRLVSEFRKIAALRGAALAVTASHPSDIQRPFGGFADLIPSLLSMPGALGCAPDALRLLERLTSSVRQESADLEVLGDSEALSDSITHGIIDLIDAIASEQTLVIAIEDIHWLDRMSLRVLARLGSRQKSRKVITLLTTRQLSAVEAIAQDARSVVIEVGRLNHDASGHIISALSESSGVSIDDDMLQWLTETSAGNPLFLETLLAHFATTGQRFAVSPTLSALVARRLECLSLDAGTTLRICAMLGKYATIEVIVDALQVPRLTLLRAVGELEAARLVTIQGRCIQPFHQLIAEVAQQDWTPATKRIAHQCVATALETLLAVEPSTALMWDCAEHWVAAHNSGRALNAIRRCAARALELGRPAEAAEVLNRALDLEIAVSDQILICRQMILAADEAVEPALVFRGLEILRNHDRAQQHDEFEFAEFRATSRSWYDAPLQEAKLLQCATSEQASPNHRVTAATWLLKHADIQHNTALRSAAASAVGADILAAADDALRLEFLLVGQCARQEWDLAAETAHQVLATAKRASPQVSMTLQLNAALAFEKCGRTRDAVEAATALYRDAEARGAHRMQIRTAALLADQSFDMDDDCTASAWFDRVASILERVPDTSADIGPIIVRLTHLLTVCDTSAARSLFDRADRAGLFDEGQLRQRWRRVLTERLRQLERRPVSRDEFTGPKLGELDEATHMVGIVDFEVATTCHGLLEVAKADHAQRLMDTYLVWRSYSRQRLGRCVRAAQIELRTASNN
jgi:DNA-binding SARP family transcriptional activator